MAITKKIGGIEWDATSGNGCTVFSAEMTEAAWAGLAHIIREVKSRGWEVVEERDPSFLLDGDVWVMLRCPDSELAAKF